MLQSIRNRTTGILAIILIGGIGIAMTIGLVDMQGGVQGGNVAATVNGEEIPTNDFQQIAQRELIDREEELGTELPPVMREEVQRSVLESIVRNRVVAQFVSEQGFRVGNAQVAEHIRTMDVFQVGGQFSPEGYQVTLASQGISPAAFEEERRGAMQIEQFQSGLLDSAFFTPAEFRRFIVLESERRQAAYAVFDVEKVAASLDVSEEEARAYYTRHPERFQSEESVALEYVMVKAEELPPASEPTEDELQANYEANPGRFQAVEQRRARHILIASEGRTDDAAAQARAVDLRARLAQGEDFATLAREHSDDSGSAAQGGDLGWAGKGTFVEAFDDALFAAEPGDISQPVKTEFGYHIIQLEEVRPGASRSFAEVREEILEELRSRSAEERYYDLLDRMDDAALENPGSLGPVADVAGVAVQQVDGYTRTGGSAKLGPSRDIVNAAFSLSVLEGTENSPIIELDEGTALVLRVTEHRPSIQREFETVEEQARAGARLEKAAAIVAEQGTKVLEAARAGGDLAALLKDAGVALVTPEEPLSRGSRMVPPEVLGAIFNTAHPSPGIASFDGSALIDGSYAVFRVDAVIPGSPDDIPRAERDARKNLLARQTGVREGSAVIANLRNAAKVVVARDLFDQDDF